MSTIIDALQSIEDLIAGEGISEKEISEAENELGLQFADDYKDYLQHYGIVAFNGHELTGLTTSARTNVVTVTNSERELNSSIPNDLYVIERTDVEGIIIWQAENETVYYSSPNAEPAFLCNSLSEYILR